MGENNNLLVFLDANILAWLYGKKQTVSKKFNRQDEVDALRRLGSRKEPEVQFFYNHQESLNKFIERYGEKIKKDFKHFTAWGDIVVFNETKNYVDRFKRFLKDSNEKQDDINDVLPRVTFFKKKRIKYIITLDIKFVNRLPHIYKKIKKDVAFEQWLLKLRPDFYQIRILQPTEFENELSMTCCN